VAIWLQKNDQLEDYCFQENCSFDQQDEDRDITHYMYDLKDYKNMFLQTLNTPKLKATWDWGQHSSWDQLKEN
jgi:hypothetical protein